MENKPNYGIDTLIETVVYNQKHQQDFHRHCDYFCTDCIDKMKNYGETGYLCDKQCEYCDKFKWTIDRAKDYSKLTDTPYLDILKSWETSRSYWYLNYYQDCNQPNPESEVIFTFDTTDDFMKTVGDEGFVCPHCGLESNDAYECNHCHWKAYGLFRMDLVTIFIKDTAQMTRCFKPAAWLRKVKEE